MAHQLPPDYVAANHAAVCGVTDPSIEHPASTTTCVNAPLQERQRFGFAPNLADDKIVKRNKCVSPTDLRNAFVREEAIGAALTHIAACQDYLGTVRRLYGRLHFTVTEYVERRDQTLETLRFWRGRYRRLLAIDAARDARRRQQAADLLAAARGLIPIGWRV